MKKFKKVIIHVGHGKTGSSTIQKCMRDKKQLFIQHNILPVMTRASNFHKLLEKAFVFKDIDSNSEVRMLTSNESNEDILLLSSEKFIGYSEEALQRLKEFALEFSDDIEIILYVRHPYTFSVSLCQTLVKNGQISLGEFIEEPMVFQAKKRINSLISIFGKDSLTVKEFDRNKLYNGDVLQDFLVLLGIDKKKIPNFNMEQFNEFLSLNATLVANYLYLNNKNIPMFNWALKSELLRIPGETFFLPEQVLDKVKKKAARQLEYLENEFGIILSEPRLSCYKDQQFPDFKCDNVVAYADEVIKKLSL